MQLFLVIDISVYECLCSIYEGVLHSRTHSCYEGPFIDSVYTVQPWQPTGLFSYFHVTRHFKGIYILMLRGKLIISNLSKQMCMEPHQCSSESLTWTGGGCAGPGATSPLPRNAEPPFNFSPGRICFWHAVNMGRLMGERGGGRRAGVGMITREEILNVDC